MRPLTIVISFDADKQLMPGSIPLWTTSLLRAFGFERAKAAFQRGIAEAIFLPAHRLDHPG
jgi:hypothetical protein